MNYGIATGVNANLPYKPSSDEILYVEGRHTLKIERWRIEYYSEMLGKSLSNPADYAEGYYSLIVKLLNEPSVWNGFTEEQWCGMKSEIIDNFCFTDYIYSPREITPSLFVYHSRQKDGRYRFQQFEIGDKGILKTLQDVLVYMDYRDERDGHEYERQSSFPWGRDELVQQMQECARKLIDLGIDKDEILDNLFSSRPLCDLYIRKQGDVMLGFPSIILIRMQSVGLAPLDRALYLLFLRHPEGISYSRLPEYREELMEIYRKVMNGRDTASMRKSVEDVTDPDKNCFYEKCAHIRRAFVDRLGNYLASYYYISGDRDDVKKIVLDRAYVRWEEDGMKTEE
jgi:hypothetical protein